MAKAESIDAKTLGTSDFELSISRMIAKTPAIAETVLKAGANVIADEMRQRLEMRLTGTNRYNTLYGRSYQLPNAFGITPVKQNRNFDWDVNIGFGGYQYYRSLYNFENYRLPTPVPFQLIARVMENGANAFHRIPARPFAAPAVKAKKRQAYSVMESTAENEMNKILNGG